MKHKLFNRIALEEDGSDDLDMDTDAVIGEGGATDAAVVDVGNSDDVSAETDVDAVEKTDEEKEAEALLEAPIEYPEIGNLEVDQVAVELQEQAEEREEDQEEALEAAEDLAVAVEAFSAAVASAGYLNPSLARMAAHSLSTAKARVGYKDSSVNFALEDFSEDKRVATSKVALEDFRTVIRQIWDALIKALARAIEWLRKAFMGFFSNVKKTKEATIAVSNAVLKQRGDAKGPFATHRTQGVSDDAKYVSVPGFANLLTVSGKQPGDPAGEKEKDFPSSYMAAFEKMLELTKTHEAYPKTFGEEFVSNINMLIASIVDEKENNLPLDFLNIAEIFPPEAEGMKSIPGQAAQEGMIFAVNKGYLGDLIVVNLHSPEKPGSLEKVLESMAGWKSSVMTDSDSRHDGWLRFLTDDEIRDTTKVVLEIENELGAYQKTLDKMEWVQGELKKMAAAAADLSMGKSETFFTEGSSDGWKGSAINLVIAAVNNIVNNINNSVFDYSTRAHSVCTAWNVYLQATYKHEREILLKANAKAAV